MEDFMIDFELDLSRNDEPIFEHGFEDFEKNEFQGSWKTSEAEEARDDRLYAMVFEP